MTEINEFIPNKPLKTAVLFLIFNRLDTAKEVFEAIRKAKPPRLYIAGDGPREDHPGEAEKVQAVRDHVISSIDWHCDVKTLFRDENLGCKYAVSGAISWFFENEEMGIILEDDCLPSQSFFWFCEELLEEYKEDERIMIISGYNKRETWKEEKNDYFFSNLGGIWGWASWGRAWNLYDVDMQNLGKCIENNYLKYLLGGKLGRIRERQMRSTLQNDVDTWDYQWGFTRHINSGLAIVPSRNLISNIGFGPDATHTKNKKANDTGIKRFEISLPIVGNNIIIADGDYDALFFAHKYINNKFYKKIIKILNNKLNSGRINK